MLYKAGICPGLQTDIRIKDILENIAFFGNMCWLKGIVKEVN